MANVSFFVDTQSKYNTAMSNSKLTNGSLIVTTDSKRLYYASGTNAAVELGTRPSELRVTENDVDYVRIDPKQLLVYSGTAGNSVRSSVSTSATQHYLTFDSSSVESTAANNSASHQVGVSSSYVKATVDSGLIPRLMVYNTVGVTGGILTWMDGGLATGTSGTTTWSANVAVTHTFYVPGIVFAVNSISFKSSSNGWGSSYYKFGTPTISGFGTYNNKLCTMIKASVTCTQAASACTVTASFRCSYLGTAAEQ